MLRKVKDVTLSKGVCVAINYKIEEFGKMIKFNLDSKTKTIELEIMLDGEKEALHVKVNNYKFSEKDHRYTLVVQDIVTSRAWINVVASQYLSNHEFEIPAEYAKLLKLAI